MVAGESQKKQRRRKTETERQGKIRPYENQWVSNRGLKYAVCYCMKNKAYGGTKPHILKVKKDKPF